MRKIQTPERPALADGGLGRTATRRAIGIQRDLDVLQVLGAIAEPGGRPEHPGIGVHEADPRHVHAA